MHKASARWLWLGVVALAIAGLFAIVLVSARTPQLSAFTNLFSVALVVHVDLSVLMWFLCVAAMGWSALILKSGKAWPYWHQTAFYLIAAATALMALSPLDTPWTVIKSNYIPVLDNTMFLLSLALLAAGLVVLLVELLFHYARASARRALSYAELGWLYAGVCTALALAAFYLTGKALAPDLPHDVKFETLFWAGGHLLQFTYCAVMMAAWLILVAQITGKTLKQFAVFLSFALLAAGALYGFAGFAFYPADSGEKMQHHTRVMIEWLGLGPCLLAVVLVHGWWRHKSIAGSAVYQSALVASLALFAYGGLLGLMISGQNVTIPAHYHGSIVGVTLALMGLAYALLPSFGYVSVAQRRMAFWQPIVYGMGQVMHISGLAYSGGYGVLRKTPDAAETLALNVKIALGFMGLGGMLAIVGGLMFVVVMARAYLPGRRAEGDASV